MSIDRMPRKGDRIKFDSGGMYQDLDGKRFEVLGKHGNHKNILDILEDGKEAHTQVIVKFTDGYNAYLHFI